MVQPNYSDKITSELVYTYVARDLLKNNDGISFICYGGIGLVRDKTLASMPSWVPDWSADVKTYMLRHSKPLKPEQKEAPKENEAEKNKAKNENSPFHVAGQNILLVKAIVLGEITHLAPLSYDFVPDHALEIREQASRDFTKLTSNYKAALDLAMDHTRTRYGNQENTEEAFYRTLRADTSDDGTRPATMELVAHQALWALGQSPQCPVSGVFLPEEQHNNWTEDIKTRVCQVYLGTRKMQSTLNSKFAHMMPEEIASSKRPLSMFDNKNSGPLSSLSRYVDYTIGRQFAVLGDSGLMGLVPEGSRERDTVVWIESEDLCLVLRR
ncbi:hypothetical protein PT974_03087 [Cladobotryum mycophilum]|uniref:Uncharacterized protein n=1 Tax=Cladobotryum mycophilum TaxID=491253 RepID=A0ABR0SWR2_9HYPO